MRRVVVTGMGIVSSIGNNTQEVVASLREARSGIVAAEDYVRLGFRSQVHGSLKIDLDAAGGCRPAWAAARRASAGGGVPPRPASGPEGRARRKTLPDAGAPPRARRF